MLVKEYANEGGHWYDNMGNPAYTQIGSTTGKERPTTVADARKLNLYPSVSTIISCLDKPGLTRWKNEQLLLAALTLPRGLEESEEDWLVRVMRDSQEQSKTARNRGTEIHGIIEMFMEGFYLPEVPRYCHEVEKALEDTYGGQLWSVEKSFANLQYKFGGKLDLSSRSDDIREWPGAVCDVKTTEKDVDSVKVMFEHILQLAAYRIGMNMPEANCAIIYVNGITNKVKLLEVAQADLRSGWDMFSHLLAFYRIRNKL